MKIALMLCATLSLIGPLHVQACTAEEATAKAERLAARIRALTQRDPQRAARLRQELKALDPQTSAQALEDACRAYDQRFQELEHAAQELKDQGAE